MITFADDVRFFRNGVRRLVKNHKNYERRRCFPGSTDEIHIITVETIRLMGYERFLFFSRGNAVMMQDKAKFRYNTIIFNI